MHATLPVTTRYVGWGKSPISPIVTTLLPGATELALSFGIKFSVLPVPGTYVAIESIHFHGVQTYEWLGSWVPRTFTQTFLNGAEQTFAYTSSDGVYLGVAPDRLGGYCFTLGMSDEVPFRSSVSIVPGTYHRIDIIADCSTDEWKADWRVDNISQIEVVREQRAESFAFDSGASNWRQYIFAADVSREYNDFDATALVAATDGTYPLA